MKQIVSNVFSGGLNMDTNELTTPENILTDCLNGTLITYNGKEFTLQNDFGNGIIESAKLKPGFVPIGIKEYGGIVYIVSHNPMTMESEFGSFPSPERNVTPEKKGVPLESTGVGTIEVNSSDFISSGEVSVMSIKRDLMKSSDFSLNPGDRFAIFFTDEANFNNLSSLLTAGDNRKYYKLKVVKVSENGILPLDSFNIYKKSDIVFDNENVKYDVYKENSIGTLAILMQLETIDNFDFVIKEKTISSDPNNKIALVTATATCRSLVKFKGFKLSITEVSTGSVVYEKYLYANKPNDNYNTVKMEFELSGFNPEVEYSFKAVPFSQFNMYAKNEFALYTRIKNYIFGKRYAEGSDKYNFSLFKYYVEGSNLKLNYNYTVNTAGNIVASYIEFYDVWSNCSNIYHVGDFISGADSFVSIKLDSIPATQTFSSTDICGVPISDLATFETYHNNDPLKMLFKPALATTGITNQGSKVVRLNSSLRKNHCYIVRISVIEEVVDASNNKILKYNDVYRYMYTNGVLNNYYFDTTLNNMSDVSYPSVNINFTKDQFNKAESESTLPGVRTGSHTTVNNVQYPYSIIKQSDAHPSDVKNFKTEIKTQKDISISMKYVLDKSVLNTVFGIPNYSAISIGNIINGNTSVLEVPTFVGNSSLSSNLSTNSSVSITNSSSLIDSNNDINISLNVKGITSRMFYGVSSYNLANVRTLNTFYWTSLYDQLHSTLKNEKTLIEFGIKREYHYSGSSNRYRIGMKSDGYTPSQTTQKIYNDNRDRDAILTNPNSTATTNGVGGPDGNIVFNFLSTNGINTAGFIGKFIGGNYYGLDTNVADTVSRNEYVLMLRHLLRNGDMEYGICPAPFLPEPGTYFFENLYGSIKDICDSIVNVSRGNVSYMYFAPTNSNICYNGQFQTAFKVSGYKIPINISSGSVSNIVFLSNGNNTLVPYTSSLIKNYINTKAAALELTSTATVVFSCPEKEDSIYTNKISSDLIPVFLASTSNVDIVVDDIVLNPIVDQFEKNLYEEAVKYALEDQDLKEKTTFQETGKLITEGITSKKPEYDKYAALFEIRDNFFNYKGAYARGLSSDGTDDRRFRDFPDVLVDFVK